MRKFCETHVDSELMVIGHIPQASFPLAKSSLPSEFQNDIASGDMVYPKVKPFYLPDRDILKCPRCGILVLRASPIKKRAVFNERYIQQK